jgi:predicted Rdx family selenoprotein
MTHRIVAKWVSRSGKHHVTLLHDDLGYVYVAPGCGGVLGRFASDDEAITEIQRRVDDGLFQPDANKTPMSREVTS